MVPWGVTAFRIPGWGDKSKKEPVGRQFRKENPELISSAVRKEAPHAALDTAWWIDVAKEPHPTTTERCFGAAHLDAWQEKVRRSRDFKPLPAKSIRIYPNSV